MNEDSSSIHYLSTKGVTIFKPTTLTIDVSSYINGDDLVFIHPDKTIIEKDVFKSKQVIYKDGYTDILQSLEDALILCGKVLLVIVIILIMIGIIYIV